MNDAHARRARANPKEATLSMHRSALLAALVLPACHAKFKNAAPGIDAVRVQVVTKGGPEAQLGMVPAWTDNDLVNAAIVATNVTQAVKSVDQERRIGAAVDVEDINTEFYYGIEETLTGAPFDLTEDERAALLQLELLEYGLFVPYLGAPGRFEYTFRARLYTPDGDRVYRKRMSCDTGVGDPAASARVLGFVNNVKQVERMTDDEINDAFAAVARYCGQQFVVKMRKNAG